MRASVGGKSLTQFSPTFLFPSPVRTFVVEGPPPRVAAALAIIVAAVERYVELTDGRAAGAAVERAQRVCGIVFHYQPPPKAAVPTAAGLKRSPRRGGGGGGGALAAAAGWGGGGAGAGWGSPPAAAPRYALDGLLRCLRNEDAEAGGGGGAGAPLTCAARAASAPGALPVVAASNVSPPPSLAALWASTAPDGDGDRWAKLATPAVAADAASPRSAVDALCRLLEADASPITAPPPHRPPLAESAQPAWPPPGATPALGLAASAPGPAPASGAWVQGEHPLWRE